MGIQQYFIDKIIQKSLNEIKERRNHTSLTKISRIVILVDEQVSFNDNAFMALQKLMHLDHTHFTIITYKDKKSDYNEFRGTVILANDINWKGKIKSETILETLNKEFDLLIDYTQANNQKKQLIAVLCKAGLRVGFSDKMDELYDFMIAVNPKEIDKFNKELVRYLNILKLI